MEDAKLKSRHIIDLRQSAGAASARSRPRPSRKADTPKPPERQKVPAAPAPVVSAPATLRSPAPAPVAASGKPSQPTYLDPPRERRFWPAFWRFLILVVVLGAVITGGVYLYLKYYT